MSQLGYTWYPQDWWTSQTFRRLKRYPLVRYAIRELFDMMYKEGEPIEMNRDYLIDDFNIELSDEEYDKLLEFITVSPDGKWWIDSIRKRISKAESARENGKKGGRPKSSKNDKKNEFQETQKPREKTQQENPKNPPLEIESKIESKIEKENIKEDICADDFSKISKTKSDFSESDFLKIFKAKRLEVDKQKSGYDKLITFEKQNFKNLINSGYTKQDFEDAVSGLFFQNTLPAVRIRPDWILKEENFTKMIDSWRNKKKIYSSDNNNDSRQTAQFSNPVL